MAKVSIVIPTYNRDHLVADAINSALNQEIDDLEVVVLDDGSTDNTRDVVSRFADRRMVYVYQENQGMTAAFNAGVAHSTGDYISLLGSDDWYLPNGLLPLLDALEQRPELGAAVGGFICVSDEGKTRREASPWHSYPSLDVKTWLFWCPTVLQASLIRRSWIQAVNGFDPAIDCAQDWDFGLRLAYAGCKMSWIKKSIFCYRLHKNQMSRDANVVRRAYGRVLDKFFALPDLPASLQDLKARAYAHSSLKAAIRAFEAGEWGDGQADLERAIQLDPRLLSQGDQQIFELLVDWASGSQALDPYTYIEAVFDHLPASLTILQRRRRAALAAVAMAGFFAAHQSGDSATVRRTLLQGLRRDPSWLLNRGVMSICAEAFAGPAVASFGRSVARSLLRHGF